MITFLLFVVCYYKMELVLGHGTLRILATAEILVNVSNKCIIKHYLSHCRFGCFVFRYIDKVKFIVLSSPLALVHWQKAIQLGWFCYFPVVPDSEETCDVYKGKLLLNILFVLLLNNCFNTLII